MRVLVFIVCIAACLLALDFAAAEEVLVLRSDAGGQFNVRSNAQLSLTFEVAEDVQRVDVTIVDRNDTGIRELSATRDEQINQVTVLWDGKDHKGKTVPDEVYGIRARAYKGDEILAALDIVETDTRPVSLKGGVDQRGQFTTILNEPSRLQVRIGISGGPLLKTLYDWQAAPKGKFVLPWDGYDQSKISYIAGNDKLKTLILAKPLDQRMILTYGNSPDRDTSDSAVSLKLNDATDSNAPISVKVGDFKDAQRNSGDLFEVVFYINNQFVSEEERGYLPLDWNWNPVGIQPGRHTVTVNLIGFGGDIRVGSMFLELPE